MQGLRGNQTESVEPACHGCLLLSLSSFESCWWCQQAADASRSGPYLGTQLLFLTTLPALKALVQVATQAGFKLQAEVFGSVCHAEQLDDAVHPAGMIHRNTKSVSHRLRVTAAPASLLDNMLKRSCQLHSKSAVAHLSSCKRDRMQHSREIFSQ
jgi:hypothetical protein